jgi:DNA-binding NarL/FixJ family response regulator
MQPIGEDVVSGVLTPSPLTTAREAFFRGDLDACFEAIDSGTALSVEERRETTLLRARALSRSGRFAEVVALLDPVLGTFVTIDEACTAKMLHAVAVARSGVRGGIEKSLALLEAIAAAAHELGAHHAIQGEISYARALTYWLKRDFDSVLRHAVAAERANADAISVRATSLRGYVALAKERYPEALELFRFALRGYRACRERDLDLAFRVVVQIAALEVSLRSASVLGTHALPDDAGRFIDDPTPNTPNVFRMEIAALDAWLFALDGDRRRAYQKARLAVRLAPNEAWRVWALATCAAISAALDDEDWAQEFAVEASEISGTIDWNATDDEERLALLHLTEVLAQANPPEAARTLLRYDLLTTRADRALLMDSNPRIWIHETFVRALVYRNAGDNERASEALQNVRNEAHRIGNRWREALALIELDVLEPERIDSRPLQSAADLITEHFPRSFLARRLRGWARVLMDPIASKLAPQPRNVLRHVLSGKNAKEIAMMMGLSEDTIKGYLKTLFRAFSVNSAPQLIVTCYERGLGLPPRRDPPSDAGAPTTGRTFRKQPRPQRVSNL